MISRGLYGAVVASQEKDRLKTEMLYKLRETKANLLKMTDNQLDTTTKRTIAENEQMSSELAWQSKETEKLIRCAAHRPRPAIPAANPPPPPSLPMHLRDVCVARRPWAAAATAGATTSCSARTRASSASSRCRARCSGSLPKR